MDPLPLGRCLSRPCPRWATLVCGHCQRAVCAEHHEVHQKALHLRAHRLNNQLNHFREQTFLLPDQRIREKIEEWTERSREEIAGQSMQMISMLEELKNIERTIGQPLTELLRLSNASISMDELQRLEKQYQQVQQTVNNIKRVIGMTPEG